MFVTMGLHSKLDTDDGSFNTQDDFCQMDLLDEALAEEGV
jgi:hypothetical protein